jgi:hypothetical protein
MTTRLYPATVTVPAGTAIAAPFSQAVPLEDGKLVSIRLVIPDGHAGLTGIRFTRAGTQVIPYSQTVSWIISNDDKIEIEYDGDMSATGVVAVAYNTDIFDHAFYLLCRVDDPPPRPAVSVDAATASTVATAPDAGVADLADLGAAQGGPGDGTDAAPDDQLPPDVPADAGPAPPPPKPILVHHPVTVR